MKQMIEKVLEIGAPTKIAVLTAIIAFWGWGQVINNNFPSAMDFVFVVGGVLLMVPITLIGRRALDLYPARIAEITAVVQGLRFVLLGAAIIKAIKTADAWTMGMVLPIPEAIGLTVLIITGAALAFTMVNLAARGLGAPALIASAKLATDWLYSKTRNPMVLAMFLWLISWGLYLQSGAFVAWVLFLVVPVEVLFEKLYEERELEFRFGESYRQYKERTPFLFPRIELPQFSDMIAAGRHYLLSVLLAVVAALSIAGTAFAANWMEIPFSNGGAYIDTDVKENQNIMVFWFLSKKVQNMSGYQAELTSKKDSWTYEGKPFAICLRKIEVNFSKSPREVRSAFAIYFDTDGNQVGRTEVTQSDWVAESGPRIWADLLRAFFSKEAEDAGGIPVLAINK